MVSIDYKTIGRSIASRRVAHGLTQKDLAVAIGISQNTICSYETGSSSPSFANAGAIAEVLGCTVDDLLRIPD